MTDRLNTLLDRATRGVLLGDEATALREEIANLRAQAQRATSAATTAGCQQAYHAQVRRQLDETRQTLTAAEDELAWHRQQRRTEGRLRAAWQSARRRAVTRTESRASAWRQYEAAMDGWNSEADAHASRLAAVQVALSRHLGRDTLAEAVQAALNGASEHPVVDTCHTVTVDGETVRVRGAGPLGPVGEIALAEVIRAAKRRYAAAVPAQLPAESGNAEDCPACSERSDLPYPFLCPGHPAATPTSN